MLSTLTNLLKKPVEALGFEFLGVEFISNSKGAVSRSKTLRVYIDHPNGLSLDQCGQVTRQISAVLDVEDPIPSPFILEVSSPGVERPLFTLDHYQRYLNAEVALDLSQSVQGKKRWQGILVSADEDAVVLKLGSQSLVFARSRIQRAHLVFNYHCRRLSHE